MNFNYLSLHYEYPYSQMAQNNNPPFEIIFTCTTEHDANLLTNYLCNIRDIASNSVNLQAEQIALEQEILGGSWGFDLVFDSQFIFFKYDEFIF